MREIVFVNIVQKLSATFGNPKYIDRYYGYIWSINQKYISFNIIETGYQIEEMYVYIFKKLPLARRITYTDYTLLDTMITHTLEKHCFTCDNFLHYKLIGNEYLYFGLGALSPLPARKATLCRGHPACGASAICTFWWWQTSVL